MSDTARKIEVMQHFENGGEIERLCVSNGWVPCFEPRWNWVAYNYRIKEEPKTKTLYYYLKRRSTGEIKIFTNRDPSPDEWKLIKTEEVEL